MYDGDPESSLFGGLAVGVPGEIAGYGEASKMFGNLPWKRLFQESINLMRDGLPVPPELANRIQKFGDFMLEDPDWKFLYPEGKLLVENDILYRRNFSKTLEQISEEGPETFYNSSISKSLAAYVQQRGGIMTEDDIANYTVRIEEPIHGWYHGRQIITCGAPCSGPALIQALNILEGFSLGQKGHMSPDEVHLLVEAMKCTLQKTRLMLDAAAARTELGDPFDPIADRPGRISELTSKDFAARLRANISLTHTHPWEYYNPKYDLPHNHGTTHISVIDNQGMTVSLTSTINLIWGSRLHDPTTGIILNDEMDDFSQMNNSNAFRLEPSPYNYIRPFKRPMSSSTPTIILSPHTGAVELVLGASGGARILTSVLDAIIKFLDWDMDLLNMVEKPRLHHQLLPDQISMEMGYRDEFLNYLKDAGHEINQYDKMSATAEIQAVRRIETENGQFRLEAISDSRKNGIAAGKHILNITDNRILSAYINLHYSIPVHSSCISSSTLSMSMISSSFCVPS
jgi:gamma-glutamyltranspeptidase/glutathione hydrolase/leukotriene-C4 hydrolase